MSWTVADLAARIYANSVNPHEAPWQSELAAKCFETACYFAAESAKRDPATGKRKGEGLGLPVDDGDMSEGEG